MTTYLIQTDSGSLYELDLSTQIIYSRWGPGKIFCIGSSTYREIADSIVKGKPIQAFIANIQDIKAYNGDNIIFNIISSGQQGNTSKVVHAWEMSNHFYKQVY